MLRILSLVSALLSSANLSLADPPRSPPQTEKEAVGKPSQIVIVSYDGAGDNKLWQRSRQTAKALNISYTYFLSCSLILNRTKVGQLYQAPGKAPSRSNIGFAHSDEEVHKRLSNIIEARREGHEIASHTCGHFDGGKWTAAEWGQEFKAFRTHLSKAWDYIERPNDKPDDWDAMLSSIKGFRAPYLSQSAALDKVLKDYDFTYDATTVSKGPDMPKDAGGILKFSLPLIPEGPAQKPIIAMDYNLFVRHSMAVETAERAQEFQDRAYAAFKSAFDKQYAGERIPLQLGFHFVKMNGGAYWDAHEKLLREVCGLSDVECLSYEKAMPLIKARMRGKTAG